MGRGESHQSRPRIASGEVSVQRPLPLRVSPWVVALWPYKDMHATSCAASRPSHPQSRSLSQQGPVSAISEGGCEIPLDLQSHLQAHLSPQKECLHRSSCSLHFSFLLLAHPVTDEQLIEVSPVPGGRSLGT